MSLLRGSERRWEPFGEIPQTPSAESGSATAEGAPPGGGIREAPATDVPAGYKRTEVGVIPESWTICELGDLFAFKNGLNKAKRFFGTGTRIVNYMDVFQRPGLTSGDLLGRVTLTRDEISSYRVRMGDVFFTRTSETVEDIGIASVMLDDPVDTAFSGFVLRARPRDGRLNHAYKQYGFAGRSVRSQVVSSATYTTRALTNGSSLSAVQIALPSLPEQRAIAAVLSDVDELIGSLETLIVKKRAIKQAAMQQLLTGRTRLPGFGGEWEARRLGELGTFRKGKGIKRTELRETGARCVRYGELYTRYRNYVVNPISRIPKDVAATSLRIEKGELLFAGSGETAEEIGICVAYIGEEPAYAGGDIIVLRAPGQHPVYLSHLLNAPAAARQKARMAQGDAVVHIRADHLAEIELPLPPLREQWAVAAVLTDMDAETAVMERRLDKTRAVKQGMMQQLLTGSIRLPFPDALAKNEPRR